VCSVLYYLWAIRPYQFICCTGRKLPMRTESKARSSSLTRSSSAVLKSTIRKLVLIAPAHAEREPATNCCYHFVHTSALCPHWFRCVLQRLTHECSLLAASTDQSTSAADMLTRKSIHYKTESVLSLTYLFMTLNTPHCL